MAKWAWENKGLDEVSALELYNWTNNDAALYTSQYAPIIKNLVAKKGRGVYDSALAVRLFGYLVESGAKRYNEEVGVGVARIPSYFPKKVRDAVATQLRDDFEEEWELGNYRELLPKKYQPESLKPRAKTKSNRGTPVGTSVHGLG